MPVRQKRLVYVGIAVGAVFLFVVGALYGYANRHSQICPNGNRPYVVAAGSTGRGDGAASSFGGVTQTKTLPNGAVETIYADGRIVERAQGAAPVAQQDDDMGQVMYLCTNGVTVTN